MKKNQLENYAGKHLSYYYIVIIVLLHSYYNDRIMITIK